MKLRAGFHLLLILGFIAATVAMLSPTRAQTPEPVAPVRDAVVSEPVYPTAYYGDLRDLPEVSVPFKSQDMPEEMVPIVKASEAPATWIDPLVDTSLDRLGGAQMPDPIMNFEGLRIQDGGGWHPPDTDGEVGPNHYIQVVNIAIGIYDKDTGAELVNLPYNSFFSPAAAPCNNTNRGDVVVMYDTMADRWLVTDFSLPSTGPVYQCMAVSMSGDPVAGGWYYYTFMVDADGSPWHDYPKYGVWPDAYYMTANMFDPWSGVYIWAFDRAAMLNGSGAIAQKFETGSMYGSLLPANLKGDLPPAGSPNYLASFSYPNTLQIWKLFIDWATPANSHLDGPTNLTTANASMINSVPQMGTTQVVDTLGDRLMFAAQYRNMGDHESLWLNHTVASGGTAGVRWYEVRDLSATPTLYQQGTYNPGDGHYRWMGSLATDQDGNMALGYSVSSSTLYPSVRYAGRLNGEALGQLPQGENSIWEGTGSQTGSNRWGDYSRMTVDPVDDCTFWYTQEYFVTTSGNWTTRIGSFKFPSCGVPKGLIEGTVYNAESMEGIAGVPVAAEGLTTTLTVETDAAGYYAMILPGSTYTLTAGPLPPAYPNSTTVTGVAVTAGQTATVDIPLTGLPNLIENVASIDDNVAGGNNNGYPEPGESGLLLYNSVTNNGGATSTDTGAYLTALTPGVTVDIGDSTYPDILPGGSAINNSPFVITIAPTVPCGTRLDFEELLVTAQGNFTVSFSLYAKVSLPRESTFFDDMESGTNGWTTGGTANTWAQTTLDSHSPTHSWTDSPSGQYSNNTNSWLRSPAIDLSGKVEAQVSFWHFYDTESGWDYGYPEYSINGGTTWQPLYTDGYTGNSGDWLEQTFDATALDNQANVRIRFRLYSDGGVTADGWYIDDVDVSYEPFECTYLPEQPGTPELIAPPDGTITASHDITFEWQPSEAGGTPDGYQLELDGVVYTTAETSWTDTLDQGVHTWRVSAFNTGGASAYTDPWTVEILDWPGTPELIAPTDGTITATQDITFEWQPAEGAGAPAGYHLELDGTVYTTTQTVWPTMLDLGAHTWRVRAFNVSGESAYTDAWTVTVQIYFKVYLPLVSKNQ